MITKLSDLSWKEAKDAYEKGATVIVPIGSNEQHGPHMPVNCDSYFVTEVVKGVIKLVESKMPIYRTPTVWTGYSPHHKNFPGTITLRIENFMGVIYDICESLILHNVRRIVLINGHGGNGAPLKVVGSKVGEYLGKSPHVFSYWEIIKNISKEIDFIEEGPSGIPGHAGELETSLRMFLAPDTIRENELKTAEYIISDPNPHDASVYEYQQWEDVTYKGYTGHPKWATKEKGEKIYNLIVSRISEYLIKDYQDWKKSDNS